MKTVIEMAREAGKTKWFGTHPDGTNDFLGVEFTPEQLERFAALVRADLMKQVMNTCEAEYKMYDKMVEEDDAGHEEATAMIHLTRKLEKLK